MISSVLWRVTTWNLSCAGTLAISTIAPYTAWLTILRRSGGACLLRSILTSGISSSPLGLKLSGTGGRKSQTEGAREPQQLDCQRDLVSTVTCAKRIIIMNSMRDTQYDREDREPPSTRGRHRSTIPDKGGRPALRNPVGSIASYPAPGGELEYASFRSVAASSCTELDGAARLRARIANPARGRGPGRHDSGKGFADRASEAWDGTRRRRFRPG